MVLRKRSIRVRKQILSVSFALLGEVFRAQKKHNPLCEPKIC